MSYYEVNEIKSKYFLKKFHRFTRDHPLSTYSKIFRKTNISYPLIRKAHVRVRIRRLEMLVSRKIFEYVLNGWPYCNHGFRVKATRETKKYTNFISLKR